MSELREVLTKPMDIKKETLKKQKERIVILVKKFFL